MWVRAALLIGLLVVGLVVRTSGILAPTPADPALPPMPGAAKVVPGLVRAGLPNEDEMVLLRDTLGVRVIAVTGEASVEERAGVKAFGLRMEEFPLAGDAAPSAEQVAALIALVKANTAAGAVVYLHGTSDAGAAVTMAAMVQLATGTSLPDALAGLSDTARVSLTPAQTRALQEVWDVMRGTGPANSPYASLRTVP
ncbi:hypothetical protein [Pseudonocardia zijingensis]|uniref:hypothetical protein n=1 Tax=Pseudonocardia zijingensis TaxID=153376 RepID=UPI0031D220F9